MKEKLLETVADISYYAGQLGYYSGDSRADINSFIFWAREFEFLHKVTDWDEENYMLAIEDFSHKKVQENECIHY